MKLKILDLFSGLGGFSLGLERTGHFKTVAFCDNDKFSNLVLQKHWKGVKIYNNVKEITKERLEADGIESPNIITGGFPCQPFSVAGKQKGTSDDRHLWPEMFRIIKAFKPRFVIGENVRGIINIQDGMVFETVRTDLESEGYEVQPFIIPASGVGAPHRRERVWIIAIREDMENSRRTLRQGTELGAANEDETRKENAHQHQRSGSPSEFDVADTDTRLGNGQKKEIQTGRNTSNTSSEDVANANLNGEKWNQPEDGQGGRTEQSGEDVADTITRNVETGRERQRGVRTESQGQGTSNNVASSGETKRTEKKLADTNGERLEGQRQGSRELSKTFFATDSSEERQRTMDQGWWSVEPNLGRVAHGVSGRVHRLKGLGNSIIPQIAEEIGRAIIKAMK